MKSILIIIRGSPATGKSTLARNLTEYFKQKSKTALLILDEFKWVMTAHEPRDEKDHKIAFDNYLFALNNYLKECYIVITEDTWLVGKRHKDKSTDITKVIALAKKYKVPIHQFLLKADWNTVKKYNKLRSPSVWEPELKEIYTKTYAWKRPDEHISNIEDKTPEVVAKEVIDKVI